MKTALAIWNVFKIFIVVFCVMLAYDATRDDAGSAWNKATAKLNGATIEYLVSP